jgi:tryptophan halogenase
MIPSLAVARVVIVGGGTAGWMTAAALGRVMGQMPGLTIELVESDAIGTVGVGEATIPNIRIFNDMLGIDEAEFLAATGGTIKLGIEFADWAHLGSRFMHPFGTNGIDMAGVEFHHHWLKAQALGAPYGIEDFSIGAKAAYAGKFVPPRPDQPNSPLARLGYAYHFDAGRYARYLRQLAEGFGVRRHEGRITHASQDPETGNVTQLHLEDGRAITGDLFIDCSGLRALLIGETLGVPFIDWSDFLPCNSAVAVPCAHPAGQDQGRSAPYTRSTARLAGWQWRIPLQHRIGNGHVYSSAHMSDDAALDLLLAHLDTPPLADPKLIRFRAGYRARLWEKNVVAMGLAGGFLEPLESTAIHLVQATIARLLAYWPDAGHHAPERHRFNRETITDYVEIRDLLVLHYATTQRTDTAFWRDCAALPRPDSLTEKLELYTQSGRIHTEQGATFAHESWLAVMDGQGLKAGGFHPAARLLDDAETLKRLGYIREVIANAVAAMPTQGDFLRQAGALTPAFA